MTGGSAAVRARYLSLCAERSGGVTSRTPQSADVVRLHENRSKAFDGEAANELIASWSNPGRVKRAACLGCGADDRSKDTLLVIQDNIGWDGARRCTQSRLEERNQLCGSQNVMV